MPHLNNHDSIVIRIVRKFLYSNLSLLLIIFSMAVGIAALFVTPREEEPQIVVPMADVIVSVPGRSAAEIEQLISTRLEKMLSQIDGVEYVYSMSRPGQAIVTVRFYVGQDREKSLILLYNKIQENQDRVPPSVAGWLVKPIEIDDVPIVTVAVTQRPGAKPAPDDALLRRVAEELVDRIHASNTGISSVVGGRPRELRVDLKPESLAAYGISVEQVADALRNTNQSQRAGQFQRDNHLTVVDAGELFRTADELAGCVIAVKDNRLVYLRDVADVSDGISDIDSYVRFGRGPAIAAADHVSLAAGTVLGRDPDTLSHERGSTPSVTIAFAKKKGSNAVWVAQDILEQIQELQKQIVPDNIELAITRNLGVVANQKINDLVEVLLAAILIVIALLTVALGWRSALVVAAAVPVVFALTLAVNYLFGYSINRVTLFALILSVGLLVDDPIVDVENIYRHFHIHRKSSRPIVLEAVNEVRPPLIVATIAVILSFLPMFFITGMMGPYMRPMALNVPITMVMSMVVSFTITPWMAFHILKVKRAKKSSKVAADENTLAHAPEDTGTATAHDFSDASSQDIEKTLTYRIFRPILQPLLQRRWVTWSFIGTIVLLLILTAIMPLMRLVPLKMLPFDNRNELQLVIDMPQNATLEQTDATIRDLEDYLQTVPEIVAYETYAGTPSPMDFNGMVRHYYMRRGANQGEIRIILADKSKRVQQSHELALRLRNDLTAIAQVNHANLKIVESPPGPPVLATVVAEIYGPPDVTNDTLRHAAQLTAQRLAQEPAVVDIDTSVETPPQRAVFRVDRDKAALNGISDAQLSQALAIALGGQAVTTAAAPGERNELSIVMRLPEAQRSSLPDLSRLYVTGFEGRTVPLAELGQWNTSEDEQTIYHKNLRRVQYVYAEMAGRAPADAILDVQADLRPDGHADADSSVPVIKSPTDRGSFFNNGRGLLWSVPRGIKVDFSGEGEWQITLDVFRDLGLAFAAALLAIYILLVHETSSFLLPVIVMLAIPLTILGIMPGFYLLNQLGVRSVGGFGDPVFFTATAMIGMIALAGIVTRNAIILVDFIHHALARGRTLFQAIMESSTVRLRPVLLTAGAAMLGAWPITLDPIFSGLAWALIFGLIASTAFTLLVIPVSYWLIFRNKPGHGLPMQTDEAP